MSIWTTQEVHDAAVAALKIDRVRAQTGTAAFVEVHIHGHGTMAALMRRVEEQWTIDRLYTPEHEIPGAVAVVVVGVW